MPWNWFYKCWFDGRYNDVRLKKGAYKNEEALLYPQCICFIVLAIFAEKIFRKSSENGFNKANKNKWYNKDTVKRKEKMTWKN
jgi:hypothetical protein